MKFGQERKKDVTIVHNKPKTALLIAIKDFFATSRKTAERNSAVEEHRRMREYLRKMERDGVQRVKMFLIITAAYVLFWGPLFFVTLINHPIVGSNPLGHEITLHISYVHAIVNPTLFLVLHRGLRKAALDACCGWVPAWIGPPPVPTPPDPPRRTTVPEIACLKPPMPAHPDSAMVIKYYM
ncbi:uncharacterized protein LOC143202662 [Rhynchophorus ferrugineus]|uniref:uncharacterized protein LOC143202662 n=1 Tax=Rhynchophorus ferrugineus TaxID=354439 RepID=UPI003FCE846C